MPRPTRPVLLMLALSLAACGGADAPDPAACQEVRMVSTQTGFRLAGGNSPNLTVRQGGCVEFVNQDAAAVHNAQSRAGTPGDRAFNTAILAQGQRQRVVFNVAGQIEYICGVGSHAATMSGRITVQP